MISIESAAAIALNCVRPPHKLPEPLHIAHRIADKAADLARTAPKEEIPLESEFSET